MLIQFNLKRKPKEIYINSNYLMLLKNKGFLFKKILNLKIKKQFITISVKEINNILL